MPLANYPMVLIHLGQCNLCTFHCDPLFRFVLAPRRRAGLLG